MVVLETVGGLLLTFLIAALVVRHDASKVGWRRYVGIQHLWAVFAIDALVAGGLYIALTVIAAGGWHILAKNGAVPSRSSTQPWSLVLYAVTSGLGSLPLLGRRMPHVSKRLTELRESCVTTIQNTSVNKESYRHEIVAVPALAKFQADALARRVKQWGRNKRLPNADIKLMVKYATATDIDNRLTLCSSLYNRPGGASFLDSLIKESRKLP